MTPNFEALSDLAVRVTAAEARHAQATATLRSAEQARDAIAGRLADLAGKRQAIVLRRSEGREEPTDAETLAAR